MGTHARVADLLVVGGGVLGLTIALRTQQAGARTVLVDVGEGSSASAVAAGMLAPASEAWLDDLRPEAAALLLQARDLWPALAAEIGVALDRSGALLTPRPPRDPAGFTTVADPAALTTACLSGGAVWSSHDWRLEPQDALAALRRAFEEAGGRTERRRFDPVEAITEQLVLAAGPGARTLAPLAPELTVLTPIKGHIALAPEIAFAGPVIRFPGGYLSPSAHGLLVGASMEHGADDTEVRPEALEALRVAALPYAPQLAGARLVGRAGVRMATPDGLPLAGRSRTGVLVAAGARRNGWLFAPLIADTVAAMLLGGDGGTPARRLDPQRFG